MEIKDIYLTDEQFLTLLKRGRDNLESVDKIRCYDSEEVGNKYTETNVGMCNEELTTKETAMWPEDFPRRKSSKYRVKGQKCPLDARQNVDDFGSGCFYSCRIFKPKKFGGKPNLEEIKKLFDEEIESREKKNG